MRDIMIFERVLKKGKGLNMEDERKMDLMKWSMDLRIFIKEKRLKRIEELGKLIIGNKDIRSKEEKIDEKEVEGIENGKKKEWRRLRRGIEDRRRKRSKRMEEVEDKGKRSDEIIKKVIRRENVEELRRKRIEDR